MTEPFKSEKFPRLAAVSEAPPETGDGRTLSARAREQVAQMFRRAGIKVSAVRRAGPQSPHLRCETRSLKVWPRVSVQRNKFQVKQRMSEAIAFGHLEDPRNIPVLFHRRPGDKFMAVLSAEDFVQLVRLADEMSAILEQHGMAGEVAR